MRSGALHFVGSGDKMKSLIEKAFFLKKVRLFCDLELELLLAIAEKLHEDDYDAGEKVFIPGQVANRIYFIEDGTVQICDERLKPFCELGRGEYFGDESLFNEQPRCYTALSKTDALFLSLSRSHLLSIISECPSVAVSLLQAYSQQIHCRHKGNQLPQDLADKTGLKRLGTSNEASPGGWETANSGKGGALD